MGFSLGVIGAREELNKILIVRQATQWVSTGKMPIRIQLDMFFASVLMPEALFREPWYQGSIAFNYLYYVEVLRLIRAFLFGSWCLDDDVL